MPDPRLAPSPYMGVGGHRTRMHAKLRLAQQKGGVVTNCEKVPEDEYGRLFTKKCLVSVIKHSVKGQKDVFEKLGVTIPDSYSP